MQSTVVGASAAADTLQEPWTTVGRVVEIWNGKIGDPEAPVSVFPTEWKLDVRQGIRSFQDLMPPPPGKPGPPPLQGGLASGLAGREKEKIRPGEFFGWNKRMPAPAGLALYLYIRYYKIIQYDLKEC